MTTTKGKPVSMGICPRVKLVLVQGQAGTASTPEGGSMDFTPGAITSKLAGDIDSLAAVFEGDPEAHMKLNDEELDALRSAVIRLHNSLATAVDIRCGRYDG